MNRKLIATALASALFAAGAAGVSLAQAPAPGANPPSAQGPRGPQDRPAFMRPTERVEARLAYVKTALKITPAQETQWNAYASFLRKTAQDVEQRFAQRPPRGGPGAPGAGPRGPRGPRPNAIERLEREQAMHVEASNRLRELIAVQKPLYESLSAEQRQTADVVLNQRGRAMQARGERFRRMGPQRPGPSA